MEDEINFIHPAHFKILYENVAEIKILLMNIMEILVKINRPYFLDIEDHPNRTLYDILESIERTLERKL